MTIINNDNFKSEVLEEKGVVLVVFGTSWCNPCRQLTKTLEENEAQLDAKIVKVDADESSSLAGQYNVRSVPTLILFKDGKTIQNATGNLPIEKLKAFIALAK